MFVFSTFVVSRNPLTADLAKSLVDKIIQHMDDPASNFYGSFYMQLYIYLNPH